MKDNCVICGVETPYDRSTHVNMRVGYIEGAGQLCTSCFNDTDETILLPVQVVKNTPNDLELGGLVREIYHQRIRGGEQ